MNYEEALNYIFSVGWKDRKPGLRRIETLCGLLGNPHGGLSFIHVAGTNGKGSFCAMLASVLKEAGYVTGLYISPHLKAFNERMSVDGENISDGELADIVSYVRPYAESMSDDSPTEYEIACACAFIYFKRHKCDVVVTEVGMGGRLDATNVIGEPLLSVITNVSLDHVAVLGDTKAKIAKEKAGIIKKGRPVLWCGGNDEARKVVEERAKSLHSAFYETDYGMLTVNDTTLSGAASNAATSNAAASGFDYGGYKGVKTGLSGSYQAYNAANVITALSVLKSLGLPVTEIEMRRGLLAAKWPARFETLSKDPLVIFDGAHNPSGVDAALRSVREISGGKKVDFITGVLRDKNYEYIASAISEIADRIWCVAPESPRALSASEYAACFGKNAVARESFEEGVADAFLDCKTRKIPLVAIGSLHMYADFCRALENIR